MSTAKPRSSINWAEAVVTQPDGTVREVVFPAVGEATLCR
jgi:hypothetical protein